MTVFQIDKIFRDLLKSNNFFNAINGFAVTGISPFNPEVEFNKDVGVTSC